MTNPVLHARLLSALRSQWPLFSLGAVSIATVTLLSLYIFSATGVPKDELCDIVTSRFQMRCALISETRAFAAGAIVSMPATADGKPDGSAPVGTPLTHIMGPTCLYLPKQDTEPFRIIEQFRVGDLNRTIKVDNRTRVGVTLKAPGVANLDIKAGPKLSEINAIELKADEVRTGHIDQNAVAETMQSCNLRPSCFVSATSPMNRIVSSILEARSLRYLLKSSTTGEISLSAAASAGNVSFGGEVARSREIADAISAGRDSAIGVQFMPVDQVRQFVACARDLAILDVRGQTHVGGYLTDGANEMKEEKPSTGDAENLIKMEFRPRILGAGETLFTPAKAVAGAKFDSEPGNASFMLKGFLSVDAGEKYKWRDGTTRVDTPIARGEATTKIELNITGVNRSANLRVLILDVEVTQTPGPAGGMLYDNLERLSLLRADGTETNVTAQWRTLEATTSFELGRLQPSEVFKVIIARSAKLKDGRPAIRRDGLRLRLAFR